eukprot:GHVP01054411.1.p1 GENE.GHVP01054411.1~~GHVP01054411.1.p1  ORF type:complete len:100 (+),score=17.51 GHVP01054411.1:211-510(+)
MVHRKEMDDSMKWNGKGNLKSHTKSSSAFYYDKWKFQRFGLLKGNLQISKLCKQKDGSLKFSTILYGESESAVKGNLYYSAGENIQRRKLCKVTELRKF